MRASLNCVYSIEEAYDWCVVSVLQEQLALAHQKRELQHIVTGTRNLQVSQPSGRTTSELLRVL